MGLPNVMHTGRHAMDVSKGAIATTGHNIANANTEGYSRQRVHQATNTPRAGGGSNQFIGSGAHISRVERLNDEYIEKQIRNASRDVSFMEEKDIILKQTEDIFNEMGGDGLNRLMAKFFNEFRKLANDPDNEAIRQSVRESSLAIVNDFKRIRNGVDEIAKHIDSRIEGHVSDVNALCKDIRDINLRIQNLEIAGGTPNDLHDQRDKMIKDLSALIKFSAHKDNEGHICLDAEGIGPLVNGPMHEHLEARRTDADPEKGKAAGTMDIFSAHAPQGTVTHLLKGGRLGALIELRDQTVSSIVNRLDELAFNLSNAVNEIHSQGFTRSGLTGVAFFKQLDSKDDAARKMALSSELMQSADHIAAAAVPDAPGDNRIAMAIGGVQELRLMSGGRSTVDDFYNSIVADVGTVTARNRSGINQQKDIQAQLVKMRDQISGVSIDEETANLMQYQQIYGASAKVIQVADECLKTVLDLRR